MLTYIFEFAHSEMRSHVKILMSMVLICSFLKKLELGWVEKAIPPVKH